MANMFETACGRDGTHKRTSKAKITFLEANLTNAVDKSLFRFILFSKKKIEFVTITETLEN